MDLKILAAGSNREIADNITDYLKNNIEYDITECEQAPGAIAKALSELSPNVLILCLGNETPESLKNYDEISSYEKADRLGGYPFRINQKNKLREAADYIRDYMYDEAADLIREIRSTIGQD